LSLYQSPAQLRPGLSALERLVTETREVEGWGWAFFWRPRCPLPLACAASDEAIYAKLVVKKPGLEMDYVMSELDLTYPERYRDLSIPDAYERLILDCIRGGGWL